MQTAAGRSSLACAATSRPLALAAIPTISTRSGISRATLAALSPIEPVAPRTTTRLRFMKTCDVRRSVDSRSATHLTSRYPHYQPQIKEQKRGGEEKTINQIEGTAYSR